jgi:hypothetical protein
VLPRGQAGPSAAKPQRPVLCHHAGRLDVDGYGDDATVPSFGPRNTEPFRLIDEASAAKRGTPNGYRRFLAPSAWRAAIAAYKAPLVGSSIRLVAASCAVTTEAPQWRQAGGAGSEEGQWPSTLPTVTLSSYRNASLFWIMLWLVSRPGDHGMISVGLHAQQQLGRQLCPQLRVYCCIAVSEVVGHQPPPALQKKIMGGRWQYSPAVASSIPV